MRACFVNGIDPVLFKTKRFSFRKKKSFFFIFMDVQEIFFIRHTLMYTYILLYIFIFIFHINIYLLHTYVMSNVGGGGML